MRNEALEIMSMDAQKLSFTVTKTILQNLLNPEVEKNMKEAVNF